MGEYKLVFVYGTLRRGYIHHRLLSRARYLGRHTTKPRYTMLDLGAYPGVIEEGRTAVTGEVYTVSKRSLLRLDALESHPVEYTRKPIETAYGHAWMYIYRRPGGRARPIESGDWRKRDLEVSDRKTLLT